LLVIDKVPDPGGTVIVEEVGNQVVNHVSSLRQLVEKVLVVSFFKSCFRSSRSAFVLKEVIRFRREVVLDCDIGLKGLKGFHLRRTGFVV
jgi:hypothetical protein